MDHLTPGYREARLRRREAPLTARTLVWGLLGLLGALLTVWAAHSAPSAILAAGVLGGLMFGASR